MGRSLRWAQIEEVMDRRELLMLTGSLAAGLSASAAPSAFAAGKKPPAGFTGPYIDLTTPKGNVNAAVRLDANLDESKQKWASVSGTVVGVRDGEALKDLFGFEVVSVARAWRQPDNSYRVLHREAILYSDLATGDILRNWYNPYIDETVEVVDVINDPWNHYFAEEVRRKGRAGLRRPEQAAKERRGRCRTAWAGSTPATAWSRTSTHINLYYKCGAAAGHVAARELRAR
jgi:hypothetical protein